MEMGKLTAKLRDAVPVCLLVEGKEIKRYKNIEIPDDIKKLEYQDFKFDVPLNGAITFKIMFEPGVLPEVFPQARARRMRKPLAKEEQPQEVATAEDMAAEVEFQQEPATRDELPPEIIPASVVEAFAQAREDAQAAGEPEDITEVTTEVPDAPDGIVDAVEAAMDAAMEASVEAEAQPEDSEPAKKPTRKGKGKKVTTATEDKSK